jgi:hypothetical protein
MLRTVVRASCPDRHDLCEARAVGAGSPNHPKDRVRRLGASAGVFAERAPFHLHRQSSRPSFRGVSDCRAPYGLSGLRSTWRAKRSRGRTGASGSSTGTGQRSWSRPWTPAAGPGRTPGSGADGWVGVDHGLRCLVLGRSGRSGIRLADLVAPVAVTATTDPDPPTSPACETQASTAEAHRDLTQATDCRRCACREREQRAGPRSRLMLGRSESRGFGSPGPALPRGCRGVGREEREACPPGRGPVRNRSRSGSVG